MGTPALSESSESCRAAEHWDLHWEKAEHSSRMGGHKANIRSALKGRASGGGRPRHIWWDQVVPLEREEEEHQAGRTGQGNGDGTREGSSVQKGGEGGVQD